MKFILTNEVHLRSDLSIVSIHLRLADFKGGVVHLNGDGEEIFSCRLSP